MVHPENCIPIIKNKPTKKRLFYEEILHVINVHLIFEPIKYYPRPSPNDNAKQKNCVFSSPIRI